MCPNIGLNWTCHNLISYFVTLYIITLLQNMVATFVTRFLLHWLQISYDFILPLGCIHTWKYAFSQDPWKFFILCIIAFSIPSITLFSKTALLQQCFCNLTFFALYQVRTNWGWFFARFRSPCYTKNHLHLIMQTPLKSFLVIFVQFRSYRN